MDVWNLLKKALPVGAGAAALLAGLGTPAESQQRTAARADAGAVRDIDGNTYRTVVIGSQEWMAENLRTTRLNDGTPIPPVTDGAKWAGLLTPAYTWYNTDEAAHRQRYGALYNWYAVGTGKLCPQGWRVPTDADWQVLVDALGGKTVAGGKLKSVAVAGGATTDISESELEVEMPDYVPGERGAAGVPATAPERPVQPGWNYPNTGASDEAGWAAVPGGRRSYSQGGTSVFEHKGAYGYWWTASDSSLRTAWHRLMVYDNSHVSRMTDSKSDGLSVCCVRE